MYGATVSLEYHISLCRPNISNHSQRVMLRPSTFLSGRSGFYVASHPWLSVAGYVKVGFSANLETRLNMSSFKTCFTPEWCYDAVFECESHREALILEQSVLYCLSHKRVPHRELLRASSTEVLSVARTVTRRLNLTALEVESPSFAKKGSSHPDSEQQTLSNSSDESTDTTDEPDHSIELSISPYVEELDKIKLDQCTTQDTARGYKHNAYDEVDSEVLDENMEIASLNADIDTENYELTVLRPYQLEALRRVKSELDVAKRTICQMACRCGKTPVAYYVMRSHLADNGKVLYLVPGLSLLRQTAKKLHSYGLPKSVGMLLIGSDPNPIILVDGTTVCMTTDPQKIREVIQGAASLVVVSTYHSSPLLEALNVFDLIIFDECHRVCGSVEKTAFNAILLSPPRGKRLFLTATPTYDTPLRMNNQDLFGGISYRYYLREGIDAGFVNPFAVRVILGTSLDDMNPFFLEAMSLVNKMLVFCRNIKHAEQLYEALRSVSFANETDHFTVLMAHSRMSSREVASALRQFTSARRCLLLNVRLFQEGVEVPDLNAVFFAGPRYSSRDIIQSICRPLNKLANKPPSMIFLPALMNCEYDASDPINLKNYSTLIPFTDALMDEDPSLFEYMIDPQNKQYDFNIVGVRSLKLSTEKIEKFILPAVRRGVRYSTQNTDRLNRAARLPWKQVFGELRRIVLECHRYPKTNDAWVVGETSISLYRFYRYVKRGYELYLLGEQTYLHTYQIKDLEALPMWRRYGIEGPYPWKECIRTLESHLQKFGAVPPLDVHKGGFIGLDATPFERLSGCLMHINQSDGKDALRLAPDKQKVLDELCKKYGIVWRKKRTKSGKVAKESMTFITESYNQFKRLVANANETPPYRNYLDKHFPGYPQKHERMETVEHLQDGKVPPRHQVKGSKGKRGTVKTSAARKEDPGGRTVMCRVCRAHIRASQYNAHLTSNSHQQALASLGRTAK